MNWKLMFKGDYISAVEFGDKAPTVKIASVRSVKMEDEKTGREKDKCVVFFEGKDRGWVVCKTNGACLAALFGEDTDAWVGKRIVLHAIPVRFGKLTVPGIRIRASPDIPAPVQVTIKMPRKKAQTITIAATGSPAATQQRPTTNGASGAPPASSPAAAQPDVVPDPDGDTFDNEYGPETEAAAE